jgi:hypothetical protein
MVLTWKRSLTHHSSICDVLQHDKIISIYSKDGHDTCIPIGKPRVSPLLSLNTSAVIRYLICVYASHFFAGWPYSIFYEIVASLCVGCMSLVATSADSVPSSYLVRITIAPIGTIIIGRIFESEIILMPSSLKISESSSNGSYRNTDEVWWRYGISRSCDEWVADTGNNKLVLPTYQSLSVYYCLLF